MIPDLNEKHTMNLNCIFHFDNCIKELSLKITYCLPIDPGIGEFHTLPTNHLNVCKPWDENAEVYKRTVKFIQRCTRQLEAQNFLRAGLDYQEMNK